MKYIKDDKREQKRLEKLLSKTQRQSHVAVGILQDEPHDEHFSMMELAMVHEYGSRDGRIPARSFIRSTCDAKCRDHLDLVRKLQCQIILGRISVKQALMQLGEVVSKDIVQTINNGIEPGLADVLCQPKSVLLKNKEKKMAS